MERQLRLHRADLLAVAERRDCYGGIYIAKFCRFEQRKRRNALASGKLESICDQRVILILADFHFVSVRFAVVDELSFHVGCPDKCVKMSRSSNSQKIVLDDGIEIFLGFTEPGDVIKDNLGFFERLCSVRNAYLDGVDDRERRISVVDYFYSIIYTRHHNSGHMEGLQLTMQRVKIPGGGNLQFEIRGDDPDNPDYERKLVGVILYHHLANAYWPEGSEYDDNVPPFCQSFDGKQGYGEPGGVCAACAFNQFGSTANGSGKACKNMRQIYLLRSGEYLPLQLSLPPTSLRPFNDFMNLAFVARRRPSYSAIVEIGLKRAESGGYTYSVATFRKVRDLEGEGLAAVKSYAANFKEQVKSLLAQRVENYNSDVESLTGTAPLELADNGDHFSYSGVIDGERDELPG